MKACHFPRTALLCFAAVLFLHGRMPLRAQERKSETVTIYDDENFRGKSVTIGRTLSDLNSVKFTNKCESLKWSLPPGRGAILWGDKNFRRPLAVLVGSGEVKDCGKEQRNLLHAIASITFSTTPNNGYPNGISKDVPKLGE